MSEYDPNYLDFEQPILELEAKIKKIHDDPEKTAKSDKTLDKLEIERDNLISKIFNSSKKTNPKMFDIKIVLTMVDIVITLRELSIPSIKLVELIM